MRHLACVLTGLAVVITAASAAAAENRPQQHEKFVSQLWDHIHHQNHEYTSWQQASQPVEFDFGPGAEKTDRSYLNKTAAGDPAALPHRSVVVTEHLAKDGKTVTGVTAYVKARQGFDNRFNDWYWVHFTPDGTAVLASVDKQLHPQPGFITLEEDGRLWVFAVSSAELAEFVKSGELAKHVTRPGAGPEGITLKGPDAETLDAYLAARKK